MTLTLTMEMDNAAFEGDWRAEAACILRRVASDVLDGQDAGSLRDVNGNRVGGWSVEGLPEEAS